MTRWDFRFRLLVIAVLAGYGLLSLLTDSGAHVDWVAWKLIIFAGLISCGLMIRVKLKPFGPAFGRLLAGQASDEDDAAISSSIASTRPWVWLIWLGILISAFLGMYFI